MGIRLHGRFIANAGSDDVLILGGLAGIHHHVIAVIDAAAHHTVAFHLEKEGLSGRDEAAIDSDEPLPVLGDQCGLTRVYSSVKRHWLRAKCRTEAEEVDASRSRGISLY